MFEQFKAPRELLILARVIAVMGGLRAAHFVYFNLVEPPPLTPEEIATGEAELERLAEEGASIQRARYIAKANTVLIAARECEGPEAVGSCRFARLWTDRYHGHTSGLLADGGADRESLEAADAYREASRLLDEKHVPSSDKLRR